MHPGNLVLQSGAVTLIENCRRDEDEQVSLVPLVIVL